MPGLIRGVAKTAVVAGTATAVSNRVSRRQANRWADQEQQAAAQQASYPPPQYAEQQYAPPPPQYAAPPPQYAAPPQYVTPVAVAPVAVAPTAPAAPAPAAEAPAAPDTSEKLAQLQQLAELKAAGILTDAEVEEQKRKILNS